MNSTQLKCLGVFAVFALIGFGPISPGCLLGMSIVLARPAWFLDTVLNLYAGSGLSAPVVSTTQARRTRVRCFLSLLTLFIIDIAPIPVTPTIAFFIIIGRPLWFLNTVATVYQTD